MINYQKKKKSTKKLLESKMNRYFGKGTMKQLVNGMQLEVVLQFEFKKIKIL